MQEILTKKKEELQNSLNQLEQQFAQIQEQIIMHRGALRYNEMLIKELESDSESKGEAVK